MSQTGNYNPNYNLKARILLNDIVIKYDLKPLSLEHYTNDQFLMNEKVYTGEIKGFSVSVSFNPDTIKYISLHINKDRAYAKAEFSHDFISEYEFIKCVDMLIEKIERLKSKKP